MDTEAENDAKTAIAAGHEAAVEAVEAASVADAAKAAGAADVADPADADLLRRLRAGEEAAFTELVGRYHVRLTGLAASFGARGELGRDVVQETWLAALRGLDRFEGRSSLRSWLFRICANRARTMTARERRIVPFDPDLIGPWQPWQPRQPWQQDMAGSEQAGGPGEFGGLGGIGELGDESELVDLVARVEGTIAGLAGKQGRVVAMRDAQGMSSAQVCEILSISEANQRVLLHRGRARVRAVLAQG